MATTIRVHDPLAHAALVHQLGGEACVVPVPVDRDGRLIEVGSVAGLPAWDAAGSPRDLQHVGRRLARRGRLGLLLGRDRGGRLLLAVSVPPVRIAAVASDDADSPILRRLSRAARIERETPLERAIALAEALDLDAAGRRTFRELHRLLHRAIDALPGNRPRADRHAWVMAQITRLLFLRFVEAEGWLDGQPRFLAEWFDRCLAARRDPARDFLHPLFFGTLNRPPEERTCLARAFGAVPFLNGGLFEPHAVERANRWRLPRDIWCDAFAALVEHIDVTLDHDTDDGRVTPELLGRVFEGMMDAEERRRDGTFFTPPALVRSILREAVACHLAPRLDRSESAIAGAIDDPDPDLQRAMLSLTVLDPAAGSGAFLVEALHLLRGPGRAEPGRVRMLATRRLFGVDRHPGAVRVCELRLWLEVLRAMRGRSAAQVTPLPNIDASIRAGDALIDPLHGHGVESAGTAELAGRQRAIAALHGAAKRAALSAARRSERRAIEATLAADEERLDRRIAELLAHLGAPTLFGAPADLGRMARRELETLRRRRREVRDERRRIARDASWTPFALSVAFAPALARRGGFDLVVGNPPWVRAERLPVATREALAARYRWWRSGDTPGWRHLPDLSVAFLERAFTLLAPGGTLALLVPAKIATTGYAISCRAALADRATIHRVADLADDPRAGFEATTYPLALVASRRAAASGHVVRLGLGCDAPPEAQATWRGARRWTLGSTAAHRIAERLAVEHPALAERVTAQLGVKTGANAAFLDPPVEVHGHCRFALRGRDVRPFRFMRRVRLLWPADDRGTAWRFIPPAIERHLAPYRTQLEGRSDLHGARWWSLFRTSAATALHRVVWRDLARELQAAVVDDPEVIPLNTCYVAAAASAVAAESLAAWLNATPVRALARLAAEPAAGGCARFAARAVGSLPLPPEVLGDPALAGLAQAAGHRDVQGEIDERAADLLGLGEHDRRTLRDVAAHRR